MKTKQQGELALRRFKVGVLARKMEEGGGGRGGRVIAGGCRARGEGEGMKKLVAKEVKGPPRA